MFFFLRSPRQSSSRCFLLLHQQKTTYEASMDLLQYLRAATQPRMDGGDLQVFKAMLRHMKMRHGTYTEHAGSDVS